VGPAIPPSLFSLGGIDGSVTSGGVMESFSSNRTIVPAPAKAGGQRCKRWRALLLVNLLIFSRSAGI